MRFSRRVVDHRHAVRRRRRDHDIQRRADGGEVEEDVRADRALGFDLDVAALGRNPSAERLKALDVLVDRTDAEVAAPGEADLRVTEAPEFGAEEVVGPADAADELVIALSAGDVRTVDLPRAPREHPDPRPDAAQDLERGADIGDVRDVFEDAFAFDQNGCIYNGERGVLGAGNLHLSKQRVSSVDNNLFHKPVYRTFLSCGNTFLGIGMHDTITLYIIAVSMPEWKCPFEGFS